MTPENDEMRTETTRDRESRLASLYDEYYDRIARYAYARIGDRAEAEDIASEVFLRALKSLQTYQERGLPLQAWLFKIAHNLVVDYLRKMSKHRAVPIETIDIGTRDESNPEATAEVSIVLEGVKQAMQSLTEEQREVIRLRFFGGLTSREVGGLMGKRDGAVREMQSAALEKLRRLLALEA